jgi:hypothetical protein
MRGISERLLTGVAWFMGLTMTAIGVAHIVIITTNFGPEVTGDEWFSPVWMIASWEFPTAAAILGGLVFARRWPWPAAIALAVGVVSYGVHLYYFCRFPCSPCLLRREGYGRPDALQRSRLV